MKKALITGITGQDGSYLAEFLLQKGYQVHWLVRRTSNDPMLRIDDLAIHRKIVLEYWNVRDLNAIRRVMDRVIPDEVYNLAAQSHVGISFECPEETFDVNYYGLARVVNESTRVNPKVKIYQASTSEMFGNSPAPQNENTPFVPVSPYAEAKLKAHEDFVVQYRKKWFFICSWILFNHESPRRWEQFVTRKISESLVKIKLGLQNTLELGNLDASRDWGYAGDYVEAMWLMLQQDMPMDFVISTGISHTVRDFVELACSYLWIWIQWEWAWVEEFGFDVHSGKKIVLINKKFYRPNEVNYLLGDSSLAREKLFWSPKVHFSDLVRLMVDSDFKKISQENFDILWEVPRDKHFQNRDTWR